MNVDPKVIQRKISTLQPAEACGNISATCQQRGSSRIQYYENKRRFQTHDLEVFKSTPPIAKHHPNFTISLTFEKIKVLAKAHSSKVLNCLELFQKAKDIQISFVTFKKTIESRYDRWHAIENRQTKSPFELSAEWSVFSEKQNQEVPECHVKSCISGEVLIQEIFFFEVLIGGGWINLLHVLDNTFCSDAMGIMHVLRKLDTYDTVLHYVVLLYHRKSKLIV
jgi:hypothetical protein